MRALPLWTGSVYKTIERICIVVIQEAQRASIRYLLCWRLHSGILNVQNQLQVGPLSWPHPHGGGGSVKLDLGGVICYGRLSYPLSILTELWQIFPEMFFFIQCSPLTIYREFKHHLKSISLVLVFSLGTGLQTAVLSSHKGCCPLCKVLITRNPIYETVMFLFLFVCFLSLKSSGLKSNCSEILAAGSPSVHL